jgi:alpha-D-xyloside xylohydrolase
MGVAAIKTDFGEGAPVDASWHGTDALTMHNLYPLLYNRAVFERTVATTGEPVIWGRSAYAGSQRYPVYWGGDPAVRWHDLGNVLAGGLGLGLCGFPFWSQDIGGFAGTPDPALYVRWAQAGLFMTHPRAHGPIAREPWAFGDEALDIFRRYAVLRYRLLPYVVSESLELAPAGQPVMRPMLLDHQDDPATWHVADQFLLGRDLLVAPVLERGTRRRVYLPEGRWVRWDHASGGTAGIVAGPRWTEVEAPLDELPLFLREGALLPLVAAAAHTGEIRYDAMTLHVVPGVPAHRDLRRQDGPSVTVSVAGGEAGRGHVRIGLDPAVRWTVVVHGLDGTPGEVTAALGPDAVATAVTRRALPGGAVELVAPPGTTSLEFEVEEG